jgi:hypothetical protein
LRWSISEAISLANDRITAENASRQTRTVAEILRRFETQPGVILADEVGMGKTYVALAVAVSAVEATGGERPVVVMVPAGVQEKWPREWQVFEEKCLKGVSGIRATAESTRNGADFLKLLDDPSSRRRHIIFLTHGALTNSLSDPFIKLAIVRRVLRRKALTAQRRAFPSWAGKVLGYGPFQNADLVDTLLQRRPRSWRRAYESETGVVLPDDPVPSAIVDALREVDLRGLEDALAELPLRRSVYLDARLKVVRKEIGWVLQEVWKRCLAELDIELPLLILDEAHHLKNPGTRLARLFSDEGQLEQVFHRMLFLTATPFQLGHHELIQVLHRFGGVRWNDLDRDEYSKKITELEKGLDAAQGAALRLDRSWGRLTPGDVTEMGTKWWLDGSDALPERAGQAAAHFVDTRIRLRHAEKLLRPWVIRHARSERDKRRDVRCGRALRYDKDDGRGLEVEGVAVLPFLLAARMQALVSAEAHSSNRRVRAYFAEGLASSFEAYRETRKRSDAQGYLDDASGSEHSELPEDAAWYARQIDLVLPVGAAGYGASHPKIAATTERVLRLWRDGEKVLVFCFYIATGRALRSHIATALREDIISQAALKLGLRGRDSDEIISELQRFANRFFDPDAPVTKVARDLLREALLPHLPDSSDLDDAIDVALRFVRTPSFLVRHVDLGMDDRAEAFRNALSGSDASERTLHQKIEEFGVFLGDRVESERRELLAALQEIETRSEFGPHEGGRDLLPNVRLANGEVARDTRRRLMLAFNTPFFPEILVASSVMAEGVDLHLECRHVIHHDLDWNPSVLEQRTGRLDRLGSKSELTGKPIVIYEPFLEGTQDEKQFRVVMDRERWFNVLMGEKIEIDEWATDRIAERVPFPSEATEELTLRLGLGRRASEPIVTKG